MTTDTPRLVDDLGPLHRTALWLFKHGICPTLRGLPAGDDCLGTGTCVARPPGGQVPALNGVEQQSGGPGRFGILASANYIMQKSKENMTVCRAKSMGAL